MFKTLAAALAATTLVTATPVLAQRLDIGPGGPSLDLRSREQREEDRERREMRREREMARERADRGCRTVTVREENDYGRIVTRTRREC